ncbi:PfkB family carbohydrate kinase [bacterium]|nr:PfkB family carbohydrate kinase [bacterium]
MYKNVLSVGIFDILHPGHLRLFEFAKSVTSSLTIALIDDPKKSSQSIDVRKREILASGLADRVIIIKSLREISANLSTYEAIIQGSEFQKNAEFQNFLIGLSGEIKVIYWGTGPSFVSYLPSERTAENLIQNFCNRNTINTETIQATLDKIQKLNVLVIGDVIVDKYIQAETVGISREDPTMVVRPINESVFLGGAGIVAAHSAAIAKNVSLISKAGFCPSQDFVEKKMIEYGVNHTQFLKQKEFRTTTKTRIRTNDKTQIRINEFDDFVLSDEQTQYMLTYISSLDYKPDLVILSDFSLGTFTKSNVKKLIQYFKKNKIPISADSQVSSKVGDLSMYKGADYICPTEFEARSCLHDHHSNIRELSCELMKKIECTHCIQTLGSEGVYITTEGSRGKFKYDSLPALSKNPIDVAGAGDAFLVASSCALAVGASIWTAALIGSRASKAQIERYGNEPLCISDLYG